MILWHNQAIMVGAHNAVPKVQTVPYVFLILAVLRCKKEELISYQ
jgi:hypothetical protein